MQTIGFIGVGNMGGAIARGLISKNIISPNNLIMSGGSGPRTAKLQAEIGGTLLSNIEVAKHADILFIGVKPVIMPALLAEIKETLAARPNTLIVTMAVSLTIDWYEEQLSSTIKLIRTMPNTPVAVGAGMTSIIPNGNISPNELISVQAFFNALGKTVVIEERLMDTASALAGSSPALVDIFIEALADGAVAKGLPRAQAYEMAVQTIIGSAKLMQTTQLHPGELKDQVCSPGGTTIEAVKTLEKHNFRYAVIDAIGQCVDKAKK